MLRNEDGNKGHIECLSPVTQHGAQVCAQIPGEQTDDGTDAVGSNMYLSIILITKVSHPLRK